MIDAINSLVSAAKEAGYDVSQVSDGYHSFDQLYATRMAYNVAAAHLAAQSGLKVEKSLRHNGDAEPIFGGGWFAVTIYSPLGQITNHYKEEFWNLFQVQEVSELSAPWDGHDTETANSRLLTL